MVVLLMDVVVLMLFGLALIPFNTIETTQVYRQGLHLQALLSAFRTGWAR